MSSTGLAIRSEWLHNLTEHKLYNKYTCKHIYNKYNYKFDFINMVFRMPSFKSNQLNYLFMETVGSSYFVSFYILLWKMWTHIAQRAPCVSRGHHILEILALLSHTWEFNTRCVVSMCARTFAQESSLGTPLHLWALDVISDIHSWVRGTMKSKGDIGQAWSWGISWHPLMISENCKFLQLC